MSQQRLTQPRVGVMFDRDRPPEDLVGFATAVQALGVDDLWVVEDLGWAGSVASAALALAATTRLRVGIGIAPVPLRNPALLAMELATLARAFPSRLVAGLGHGVTEWMAQVGAASPHKLALLDETMTVVRALLRGETVTFDGRTVHIDGVRLVHPPAVVPPVVAGVVRPRSLELSGRVGDGTVLAEGAGPAGVADARGHTERGRAAGGATWPHEMIVFAFLHADDDPARVAAATRQAVTGQAAWLGVPPSDLFLVSGSAAAMADQVRGLWDAGADTVVLRPIGDNHLDQLRTALTELRQEAT